MAEGQVDWRSEAFRRKVITQIDEAVRSSNTQMAKSSVEMENHVFLKATSREQYLALVARLILHVKDFNNQKKQQMAGGMAPQQQQQQQQQIPPNRGMNQQPGMQDPINALQNMAMSGTGLQQPQQQGMMMQGNMPAQTIQTLQQQQITRQQLMQQQQQQQQQQQMMQQQQQQQQRQMGMAAQQNRPQLQRQDAFIVTSAQAVQPMVSSHQVLTPMSGQMQSQMGSVVSQPGPSPSSLQTNMQSVNSPPITMMPSPQSNVIMSPASRGVVYNIGSDPSPGGSLNTPGNPGSVGTAPSPASISADEQAYLEKLNKLSKFIEPLQRMIKKSEDDRSKDAEHKRVDISKMKNLRDILTNPQKRVPMPTLIKCEQVLEKIQFGSKVSSSSTTATTSSVPTMPAVLPVQASSHMCQPLLDSVAAHITSPIFNHTLQRTFGPAISAICGNPIRAPSPPAKRQKTEEKTVSIPDVLQGEIARLHKRFKVKLDPVQHTGSRSVHLICKLDDSNLPSIPPILVIIPQGYPETSPKCSTSQKDYEATPFLQMIQEVLMTQLLNLPPAFSLTSLLNVWEMSVRKACVPEA